MPYSAATVLDWRRVAAQVQALTTPQAFAMTRVSFGADYVGYVLLIWRIGMVVRIWEGTESLTIMPAFTFRLAALNSSLDFVEYAVYLFCAAHQPPLPK